MVRRMIFNVVAHNRDDHAKQHAFLFGSDRRWRLTPAYDLSYSSGPNGEHYLAVAGEARDISPEAIREVASAADVDPRRLRSIAAEVLDAVSRFTEFAAKYGLSKQTSQEVVRAVRPALARLASLGR